MLVVLTSAGCEGPQPQPSPGPESTVEDKPHEGAGHEHAEASETDEVRAALAELSPEDRQSAQRQRICPVSGELLGSMGEPVKLDVEGREVWICCAGCEGALRKDPERYLTKLNHG